MRFMRCKNRKGASITRCVCTYMLERKSTNKAITAKVTRKEHSGGVYPSPDVRMD